MADRDCNTEAAFARKAFVAVAIAGLAALLWLSRNVLLLAFAAIMLAVAARGMSDSLARTLHIGERLGLALVSLAIVGALLGVAWLFGAQLSAQLSELSGGLRGAWERLDALLSRVPAGDQIMRELETYAAGDGDVSLMSVLGRVGGWTLGFGHAFTDALLVFFAAAFLATSPAVYTNGALAFVPRASRASTKEAISQSGAALQRWLLGSLVSMAAVSIGVGLGLWFLGVPAFVALALIAGIAQFIPVVGPLLASVPGILLALTVSPEVALWAAAVYFVVSQLEANAIYPIIQERAVSIPPALTLLAILLMGVLFGPMGVMLATPVLVVVACFVKQLVLHPNEERDMSAG